MEQAKLSARKEQSPIQKSITGKNND